MDTRQRDDAMNSEEELKKLREKTDKDELADLKHRMLGGYRKDEVDQFVSRLKDQLQTVERTFKSHISELTEEKDKLRAERDELLVKVAQLEAAEEARPAEHANALKSIEAHAACLESELLEAKREAQAAADERDEVSGKLTALSALADENAAELQARIDALDGSLKESDFRLKGISEEKAALEAQAAELQREAERLLERCGSLAEENTGLAQSNGSLSFERDALQARLDADTRAAAEHTAALEHRIDELDGALAEAGSESDCLREEHAALQARLEADTRVAAECAAAMEHKIAELDKALAGAALESDRLAGERDTLQARLESETHAASERAATLERRIGELDGALAEAAQERDGLRGERDALAGRLTQKENEAAGMLQKLDDAEKSLAHKAEEARQLKGQLASAQQENGMLAEQVAALTRENEGLASQLEVAKQNIIRLLSDKEAVETMNAKLREAMNSLVVKADAIIKENAMIASQLDAERDRVQQYQAMHEKLADTLTCVRMASSILDERVQDADKTLSWGAAQIARPVVPGHRRASKTDLLDFTDGKSAALHNIVSELNSIQTNLAQYQPSSAYSDGDKKPNIRYSVEKLEVDCAAEKKDSAKDTLEKLMKPVNGEIIRNRQ